MIPGTRPPPSPIPLIWLRVAMPQRAGTAQIAGLRVRSNHNTVSVAAPPAFW